MSRAVALLAVLLALVLAGCGRGDTASNTATPSETQAPDPGRDVMSAFVAAAAARDAGAMWELLSEPSRRRYGPTLEEFETGEARALRRTLAPYAAGALPVEVSERIDDRFGVVALSRGKRAYASPLRLEGDTWKVELPGRLAIAVSGPPPGSKGKFADQIGVELVGRAGGGAAVLYLDGVTLPDPKIFSSPTRATVFANLPNGVAPGRHTVVVFATSGERAAARAWTFQP